MMKVLVIKREAQNICAVIQARFPQIVVRHCESLEELPRAIAAFEPKAILAFKPDGSGYPPDAFTSSNSLEWIHAASVGVDHLLHGDLSGVQVTNSAGVHDEVLANYAIGAVLSVNSRFHTFREQQLRRQWKPYELMPASRQKITIVGFGRIGGRVARLAKAIGMTVTGVRARSSGPMPDADRITEVGGLRYAVADANFVVVTLPRTPATFRLIDKSVIESMQPGAWLINISRGGIVDEAALRSALEEGKLGGAYMDVFETEPLPASDPLWSTKNLFLTPHTGDAAGWESSVVELFCDNMERFLKGEKLKNVIDVERGY